MNEKPQSAEEMVLYAWVGADDQIPADNRTSEFGLKQAHCPAGLIPMVACKEEKMVQQFIMTQMQELAETTGVSRMLVKFKFEKVIVEITGEQATVKETNVPDLPMA